MRHIIWRNRASAILGLLIMITPFTGFPESLRTALIVLFGLLIVIFGFARESTSGFSYNQEVETEPKPDQESIPETENEIRPKPMIAEEKIVVVNPEPTEVLMVGEKFPKYVTEMTKVKKQKSRRKKSEPISGGHEIGEVNLDAPEEDDKQ